jgi:plasmid maintenance system antidote protein VapI
MAIRLSKAAGESSQRFLVQQTKYGLRQTDEDEGFDVEPFVPA